MPTRKQLPTPQIKAALPGSSRNAGFLRPKTLLKPDTEVIEISSDSDSDGLAVNRATAELKSQLKKLQQESTRYKEENTRLQQEVKHFQQKSTLKDGTIEALENQIKQIELSKKEQEEEAQVYQEEKAQYIHGLLVWSEEIQQENAALKDAPKAGNDILMQALEDHISCEICVNKLWKPYILPGCGHTFCQDCLEDWFDTTRNQHMDTYPDYDPQPVIPIALRQQMRSPDLRVQAYARAQAHAILVEHLQPEPAYTCPTCREQVQSKPVEDFVLKSLVRTIAGTAEQSSPMKQPGRREDPWHSFFNNTEM